MTADPGRESETGFWKGLASLPEQQSFCPDCLSAESRKSFRPGGQSLHPAPPGQRMDPVTLGQSLPSRCPPLETADLDLTEWLRSVGCSWARTLPSPLRWTVAFSIRGQRLSSPGDGQGCVAVWPSLCASQGGRGSHEGAGLEDLWTMQSEELYQTRTRGCPCLPGAWLHPASALAQGVWSRLVDGAAGCPRAPRVLAGGMCGPGAQATA